MTAQCEERDRLARAYSAYVSDYLRAVQVLVILVGVMQKEDYESVREGEDQARRMAERARLELDAHIAEHGCDGQGLRSKVAAQDG